MLGSAARAPLFLAILFAAAPAGAASSLARPSVYERAADSVVLVLASDGSPEAETGAGSIISEAGLVLTAAHVIVEDGAPRPVIRVHLRPRGLRAGTAELTLRGGYDARVVALDEDLDLALLQLDHPPLGLRALALAPPSSAHRGDRVVAIGHPRDRGFWAMSAGRITGARFDFFGVDGKDVYEVDAAISPGNSGGPLLDGHGDILGVNIAIATTTGPWGTRRAGVSVRSSVIAAWLDALSAPPDPVPPSDDEALDRAVLRLFEGG